MAAFMAIANAIDCSFRAVNGGGESGGLREVSWLLLAGPAPNLLICSLSHIRLVSPLPGARNHVAQLLLAINFPASI